MNILFKAEGLVLLFIRSYNITVKLFYTLSQIQKMNKKIYTF